MDQQNRPTRADNLPQPGPGAVVSSITLVALDDGGLVPTLRRQTSIQRPPRTWWEKIRARFGARFFTVETETATPIAGRRPPG